MPDKLRTLQQNKALHLAFKQIADTLNESGIDFKQMAIMLNIPWTALLVKEVLWKETQKTLLGKDSTAKLTTSDIDKVFEIIALSISEITGQEILFPSIESLMFESIEQGHSYPQGKQ